MSEQNTEGASVALSAGRGGILGIKAGMTQVFNDKGEAIAVTVIDLSPNVITQVKAKDKNGYSAVQVGLMPKKEKASTLPEKGRLKALEGVHGFYHYQEFRLPDDAKIEGLEVGKVLSPDFVKEGDWIDLTSVSKGKGFQGTMKRFNYAGGMKTHGASVVHRSLGSIGNRADPSKVFKNKGMPGQMGNERVTIQSVRVVRVDAANRLLLVHGSVPGPRSAVVTIRRAVKRMGKK